MANQENKDQDRRILQPKRRQGDDRRDASTPIKTFVDDYIFRENDIGDQAFLIKSGTVEITKVIEGKEVVIGTLDKDSLFGEMALIDDMPRMASAKAIGNVEVIIVSREIIDKKIEDSDLFIKGLIRVLTERVRDTAKILGGSEK